MVDAAFVRDVLSLTENIPKGRVSTYGEIARALGGVRFSRAVGKALNMNPDPVEVPCHRVVRSDGAVGGYSQGVAEKIRLLAEEGVRVESGMVVDFKQKLVTAERLRRL